MNEKRERGSSMLADVFASRNQWRLKRQQRLENVQQCGLWCSSSAVSSTWTTWKMSGLVCCFGTHLYTVCWSFVRSHSQWASIKNKRSRRYKLQLFWTQKDSGDEQHKEEVTVSCTQPLLKKLVWMRVSELWTEAEDSYLGTVCSCFMGQIVLEQ